MAETAPDLAAGITQPAAKREPRVPRVVIEDYTVLESLALVAARIPRWMVLSAILGVLSAAALMFRRLDAPAPSGPSRRNPPPLRRHGVAPVVGAASPSVRATLTGGTEIRARKLTAAAASGERPAVPRAPVANAEEALAPAPGPCAMAGDNGALRARLRERYLQVRFLGSLTREEDLADTGLVARAARRFLNDGFTERALELVDLAIAASPDDAELALVNLEISFLTGDVKRFQALAASGRERSDPVMRQVILGLGHRLAPGDPQFASPVVGGIACDDARVQANAGGDPVAAIALDEELRVRLMSLPMVHAVPAAKVA